MRALEAAKAASLEDANKVRVSLRGWGELHFVEIHHTGTWPSALHRGGAERIARFYEIEESIER